MGRPVVGRPVVGGAVVGGAAVREFSTRTVVETLKVPKRDVSSDSPDSNGRLEGAQAVPTTPKPKRVNAPIERKSRLFIVALSSGSSDT